MNKESVIKIEIEDTPFGGIVVSVPYDNRDCTNNFRIKIPNSKYSDGDFSIIDLKYVVENDIKRFKELNSRSDSEHQVDIESLCIYAIKLNGNFLRIEYWFKQDNISEYEVKRMASGVMTHHYASPQYLLNPEYMVYPATHSNDVCVYW